MPIDWESTLAEHDRWLRIAVLSRVGDREAVDEVMQEVALAAVEQRAPLTETTKVRTWLRGIAIRQCLLYRRRHGRRTKLLGQLVSRARASSSTDPLHWLLSIERDQCVRDALLMLPGKDVEVLLLKYTEHWSYRQLAEHLGVSQSALEARLHRARQRLREALARRNPEEREP